MQNSDRLHWSGALYEESIQNCPLEFGVMLFEVTERQNAKCRIQTDLIGQVHYMKNPYRTRECLISQMIYRMLGKTQWKS